MLTEIHSNRERWHAIRPLMSRKPLSAFQLAEQKREPEFELLKFDQVIQRVNSSGVVPDRFYTDLDESRRETIGAYDPKARISQKRELSIGQNKIKSAMDAIIPADPKGDRFRKSLGEYVFLNRHEIAVGAFLREILADPKSKQPSGLANKPVIDRHVERAQQILFNEWKLQKNQIGRLQPHQTEKHLSVPEGPLRELARGFIRYERGLGFVMLNDHNAEFEKLPNEKRMEVPGLRDPALKQASLDWAAKVRQSELTNNSRPYMRSDVYPADQAAPEFLEQRWLRTDAYTLDDGDKPRSSYAAAFDIKTGIRPDWQENYIRAFAPRPVVCGWTRQGTLEVAIHNQETNKINYNYINQLELLSPTDIHSDGKGGIKLVSRTTRIVSQAELEDGFEMPPAEKGLHPILKDLISPTLAANQPEHDFVFRNKRMNRTLSDLKDKSATVLEEMDWDQEVSAGLIRKTHSVETPQRGGGSKTTQHGLTETIKLTKLLNSNLRRHAKERGVDFQEANLEDVVFTARVLEAKKAGLNHPSLDDWSKEEVQLTPNVFAATNYKPALISDGSAKEVVGQPVRKALAEARKKVPAGAKFLFETKDGAEALDRARKIMADEYAPTKTTEQFRETMKRNLEVVSKTDSILGDAVKRRGEIEKGFSSVLPIASETTPQAVEHSPKGAPELENDRDVDEIQPVFKHTGTSRKRAREVSNSATNANGAGETPETASLSNTAARRAWTSASDENSVSAATDQGPSNPAGQPQNDERDVARPAQTSELPKTAQTTTRLTLGRSSHIPERTVASREPSGSDVPPTLESLMVTKPLPIPSNAGATESEEACPRNTGASGTSGQRSVSPSSPINPGTTSRHQSEDGAVLLPLVQSVLNGDSAPGQFSREVSKRATSTLMEGFQKALDGSEAEQRSLSNHIQEILRMGKSTARAKGQPNLSAVDFRNSAEYIRAFLQDAIEPSPFPKRAASGDASDAIPLEDRKRPNATGQTHDQSNAGRKRRRDPSSAAAPSDLQSDRPQSDPACHIELQRSMPLPPSKKARTSSSAEPTSLKYTEQEETTRQKHTSKLPLLQSPAAAVAVVDINADIPSLRRIERSGSIEVFDLDGEDNEFPVRSSAPPASPSMYIQDPVRRLGKISEKGAAQALQNARPGRFEAASSNPRAPIRNKKRSPQGRQ
ncbi:hypothetical protein [uncultured Roseibium sp.]|uniref:hypothetical protein n=1 Tax=uncultured Roseibium sp. TaxID=1936171 RepID=UPI00261E1FC7|nr:hypothetical protein [uncultured Roseibium sp.]